jgi:hypothetical protein
MTRNRGASICFALSLLCAVLALLSVGVGTLNLPLAALAFIALGLLIYTYDWGV